MVFQPSIVNATTFKQSANYKIGSGVNKHKYLENKQNMRGSYQLLSKNLLFYILDPSKQDLRGQKQKIFFSDSQINQSKATRSCVLPYCRLYLLYLFDILGGVVVLMNTQILLPRYTVW